MNAAGTVYFVRIGIFDMFTYSDMTAHDARLLLHFYREVKDRKKVEAAEVTEAFARWEAGAFWVEFELGARKWTFGQNEAKLDIDGEKFFAFLEACLADAEKMAQVDASLEF